MNQEKLDELLRKDLTYTLKSEAGLSVVSAHFQGIVAGRIHLRYDSRMFGRVVDDYVAEQLEEHLLTSNR